MKILFLSHRVPYPPNKGDKIRSFHEIKHFSKKHEMHLIAFCDDLSELAHAKALEEFCRSVTLIPIRPSCQRLTAAVSMLGGKPWTLGYYSDSRMWTAVSEQAASIPFDVVFVYSSSMAPYALSLTKSARVLDFVDSDASKWRQYACSKSGPARWLYSYESGRLARFEQDMVREFDASVFVSAREAGHLSGKIHFIQNGIDLDYFAGIQSERSSNAIIFTGVMDYFPNVDAVTYFVYDVFPLVRESRPDAQFLIVGSRPTSQIRDLGKIPGVTVTGVVPDVRPYLAKSKVAVVPMRISRGIQNKILEAMAAGLPVVTTPEAAGGFESIADMPIAIASNPQGIADHIIRYLQEPLSTMQIAACRNHLKRHFDWSTNLTAFDHLFINLRGHIL